VILRYAARVNGLTDLVLTKLDVLSGFERIPVAVAYEADGERFEELPPNQTLFHRATPVYEYLTGWNEDLTAARTLGDLPRAARAYVDRIGELAGTPVSVVSVGPHREQSLPVA
jgi:adenylosuccinate synthase